jgi:predicted nucleic acid-binding Zn ribbon protein
MTKRRTNKKFADIGEVLKKVLQQYQPITDQSLLQVWDLWEETVGPSVSANAHPAAFKVDELLVNVSNSTWLHHLRFMENDLMGKLNKALGRNQIKHIRFKIGPI